MFLRNRLLTAVLSASLLTATALAADFERTLTVSANPELFVATGSGRVKVVPGNDASIHIKAHVYAGWNAGGDIDERIRRIAANPPIQQSGSAVHVGEVQPEDRRLYNNITIDYEISAPRAVALNLRSGSGDLEIDNLGRSLKADTGSGSIRAHGIGGPSEIHTGSGDVELQQQWQGDVKASTGSGSIRINGLNGALTARTGSGDIEANGSVTGTTRLQSGSGSIRVRAGHEGHFNVDCSTGSGSIRIPGFGHSDAHHINTAVNGGGPVLEAHTGSGDIEID